MLSDVFAFSPTELNFNAGGQAEVVSGQVVSGNYYSALGVPALVGRTITDADDNAGVTPVAVLSHRFWTNRFGNDPSVVGKQVNINNVAFTIVGVTPARLFGHEQRRFRAGRLHSYRMGAADPRRAKQHGGRRAFGGCG